MLKELAAIVSKTAPALGAALLGPFGGIVGSLIASILGNPNATPEEITAIISSNPELLHKLQQLEFDHANELAKANSQNYITEVDDRKSARTSGEKHEWQTFFLAICFLLFFAVICGCEIAGYGKLDSETKGVLIGMMLSVGYFYFGSSRGERNAANR